MAKYLLFLVTIKFCGSVDPIVTPYTVVGLVGVACSVLSGMGNAPQVISRSGCYWMGSSPFCTAADCPLSWTTMRSHNGHVWGHGFRKGLFGINLNPNYPGDGFGFGCFYNPMNVKRMCCIADGKDNTWKGNYVSTAMSITFDCAFKMDFDENISYIMEEKCGFLHCSYKTEKEADILKFNITGDCDVLSYGDYAGHTTGGKVIWKKNNQTVDTWYKVGSDFVINN